MNYRIKLMMTLLTLVVAASLQACGKPKAAAATTTTATTFPSSLQFQQPDGVK